jgi:hypothetical protein
MRVVTHTDPFLLVPLEPVHVRPPHLREPRLLDGDLIVVPKK